LACWRTKDFDDDKSPSIIKLSRVKGKQRNSRMAAMHKKKKEGKRRKESPEKG